MGGNGYNYPVVFCAYAIMTRTLGKANNTLPR